MTLYIRYLLLALLCPLATLYTKYDVPPPASMEEPKSPLAQIQEKITEAQDGTIDLRFLELNAYDLEINLESIFKLLIAKNETMHIHTINIAYNPITKLSNNFMARLATLGSFTKLIVNPDFSRPTSQKPTFEIVSAIKMPQKTSRCLSCSNSCFDFCFGCCCECIDQCSCCLGIACPCCWPCSFCDCYQKKDIGWNCARCIKCTVRQ